MFSGTVISLLSALSGAIIHFLLGRFACRDCLYDRARDYKFFIALNKAVQLEVRTSFLIINFRA